MSQVQVLITIGIIAFGTLLTRALPFVLFPPGRKTPAYVSYLGKVLPCATIGMLVIFCLKTVEPMMYPYGLPELIAVAVVALLQIWRHNTLLSIAIGTVLYMVFVQWVFV